MALIKCPECNKEISDKASECPHCGFPLAKKDKALKMEEKTQKGSPLGCFVVFLVLFAIGLLVPSKREKASEMNSVKMQFKKGECKRRSPRIINKRMEGAEWKCFSGGRWKEVNHFKQGEMHGSSLQWHPNGRRKSQGEYKDGKMVGGWTWWYPSGKKRALANRLSENGLHGKHLTWYENGKLEKEVNAANGELCGPQRKWSPRGKLLEESKEKDCPAPKSIEKTGKKSISKKAFGMVKSGWTMKRVKSLLGKPTNMTESETPGVGKVVLWHYQKNVLMGLGGAKAITITFLNGKVMNKTWTKL